MKKNILISLVLLVLSSCTHSIHMVHVSDFSPTYKQLSEGRVVKAEAEQFVIMGFVNDTNYVNEALAKLESSCREGQIQGITTEYSTSHGFFSWTNRIYIQGLCTR